ncbi:MAG: hypothetical protein ACXAC7_17240 [Candidatus Hodarchaeales archaeon]
MYLKGFLKLSLAHHPICWQYRNHVIRFKDWSFCLGCSGFYSGLFLGLGIILLGLLTYFSWFDLILIALLLYFPTIFRILNIPLFTSSKKSFRFIFRFSLGNGIAVGLLSIWIANDIYLQLFQILFGLGFYIALSFKRIIDKESFQECNTCTFLRGSNCPGFKSFYFKAEKSSNVWSVESSNQIVESN